MILNETFKLKSLCKIYNKKLLIAVDRLFIFTIEKWKKFYFTPKIAFYTGLITCFLIYSINANVLFTFGYQFVSNGTQVTQCFTTIPSTYWMAIWNQVQFIK
jgi:hypothetical protein